MIAGLALVLMDEWTLDATPAYAAAWAIVLGGAGLLGGFIYLIINGG
ncbi:MAG TPA: hypothetical protein VN047_05590 [Sphingopyxis sp.]|nr:hypothetical protein [Sphingopyxis sp.]HWW56346.1 hypothetical protein [Sphingopyxis sp.]